eukprot:TRINITY_DN8460_c0_g1_i1.p1 TRINITY_DN8460_c0_g1~~TRINITY_DN8460_c0_g1_i1.p1  ORF type:complete len:992 (+),score=125.80 TRINITY_DN8460_c0_g1_i1:102-3077(+)
MAVTNCSSIESVRRAEAAPFPDEDFADLLPAPASHTPEHDVSRKAQAASSASLAHLGGLDGHGLTKPPGAQSHSTKVSSASLDDSPFDGDAHVKLATFRCKGSGRSQRQAEAAFWPAGRPVNLHKVLEVLYKDWKLPRPNVVVNLDAGNAHPAALTTDLLRAVPQFRSWRECAEKQISMYKHNVLGPASQSLPGAVPSSPSLFSEDRGDEGKLTDMEKGARSPRGAPAFGAVSTEDGSEEILNNLIFEKMITVFAALLDASEKSNNFIVVDRTQPSGSSSTAELLLELALRKTLCSPTILVIEKKSRLRQYQSDHAKNQLDQIAKIESGAKIQGTDQAKYNAEVAPLYDAMEFLSSTSFRSQGYSDHPLPCEPDPAIILQSGGVQVMTPGGKMMVNKKRLWSQHYTQYTFASGTHYIFLADDEQSIPEDMLGTVGGVFAHGGTLAYKRLQDWLKRGKPAIMLFNTGGVTQAFAALHSAVVKRNLRDVGAILAEVSRDITSRENWAKEFGVTDVVMMLELMQRAPVALRKAIVSVDILSDSAEDVLHVVTDCFANAAGHLPELGLRTAEAYVVLHAWSLHMVLFNSAQEQRQTADILFGIQLFLLFLASVLAAFHAELTLADSRRGISSFDLAPSNVFDYLREGTRLAVILVPVLSSLLATVTQRKRAAEKWGALNAGAARIVAEIYKFRARVLEYDKDNPTQEDDKLPGEIEDGALKAEGQDYERRMRMKFVTRIQDLFSQVLDGNATHALRFRAAALASIGHQTPPVDEDELRKHVAVNLLHNSLTEFQTAKQTKRPGGDHSESMHRVPSQKHESPRDDTVQTKDVLGDVEEDDLKLPIPIETYVAMRAQPILTHFCKHAPVMSLQYTRLENLGMFINAVAIGLAIPGTLSNWVTMVISLRALIMSLVQYQAYHARLSALNNGVRDIQNLMTWWHSLSVIDRRTRKTKTEAVLVTEQAILQVQLARTSESATIFSGGNNVADDSDKAKTK